MNYVLLMYLEHMAWYAKKSWGPGDRRSNGDFDPEEDPDEGFDEEPDTTDLTPPVEQRSADLGGPGDENEDDEGFEEEPDWSDRGDDPDWERR